ncbi:MAG: hypothetical protein ACK4JD_12475 [Thermoflexales bacterium]
MNRLKTMRGMMAAGLGVCLTLAATLGDSRAQIEPLSVAAAQANMGTGFTYQGRLTSSGAPVNGTCDFQFDLWDALSGGTQIGTTLTKSGVSVTAGYFTIPNLDFGANAFNGQARWLAISVRCPAGSGSYTALSPRQALTPAPHALALPGLWTQQNAVSPNLIGGHHANTVTNGAVGATIGGGGIGGYNQRVTDDYGTVGGGSNNQAGDAAGTTNDRPYATVAGGGGNVAGGYAATVGGGLFNTAAGMTATVSGGAQNTANGSAATVGGGRNNTAGGFHATIGGGLSNATNANEAAIAGGWNNSVSGATGFIGGGGGNTVSGPYATLAGGRLNVAGGAGAFVGGGGYDGTLTGGNRALGDATTIGGGISNTASADWSTIGGGYSNTVSADVAFVGGGTLNTASGDLATIGGGYSNTVSAGAAFVGGGTLNTASGMWATISGGYSNTASGFRATIPGGYGAVADRYGQMAYASGYFSSTGDAQTSVYILRGVTDGSSSASELFLDGSGARLTLPGRTIYFEAMIVGRDASGNSAGYRISGVVEDFGGTTAYVGAASVDLVGEDDSNWDVAVTPDSIDASLRITALSPGSSARWIAVVRTVELKNP